MNLREVRKKVKSIKNVKKITKAMQLVSAVKMRKAQQAEIEGRPYREGLMNSIKKIVKNIDPTTSILLNPQPANTERDLVVLVSSNKGLAGPFNVNLFRYMFRSKLNFKNTDFLTLGNKGAQFASRMGGTILADYSSGNPLVEVSAVFDFAIDKFLAGEYRSVSVIYNQFISTMRSEVRQETLLPFKLELPVEAKENAATEIEYLIEPSPEEIIDQLLKNYIEDRIRGAVISSEAVEHSARMMAMKTATDNAGEVIESLTRVGNKLRQAKITNELLDMVTAKESVETK